MSEKSLVLSHQRGKAVSALNFPMQSARVDSIPALLTVHVNLVFSGLLHGASAALLLCVCPVLCRSVAAVSHIQTTLLQSSSVCLDLDGARSGCLTGVGGGTWRSPL